MAHVAPAGVTGTRRPDGKPAAAPGGAALDPPVLPSDLAVLEVGLIDDGEEWEDARLVDTDLSAQVAETSVLQRVELVQVLLTGTQLPELHATDLRLTGCELSGALLSSASLLRAELRNCRLTGVILSDARLRHVRFVECRLEEANLRFSRLENVVFEECSLAAADLTGAELEAVEFQRCDMQGAELHQAKVVSARLAGCRLEGLKGATRLRGAVITSDELIAVSQGLLAELGITVED